MKANTNCGKPQTDISLHKKLPQDIEAEESVFASVLIDNEAMSEIAPILSPTDFYKMAHKIIFEAFIDIRKKGDPIDLITLTNALKQKGVINDVGGAEYLAWLTDSPIAMNPKRHAEIIREKSLKRAIIKKASDVIKASFEDCPMEEIAPLVKELESRTKPEKSKYPDDDIEAMRLCNILTECPPDIEYLAHIGDIGFLPKGIVGGIVAAGGTGKSRTLLQLAIALTGGKSFYPFKSENPLSVLCLFAEDDQAEVFRRSWAISQGSFPRNLFVKSLYGQIDPLMKLEQNNPTTTEAYDWLENLIKKFPSLDVLIIDPFSRFYGLEENKSEHATRWVKALERLSDTYKLTILFTHHVNKDSMDATGRMTPKMVRGASGIVDAVRWCVGMRPMIEPEMKKYSLTGNYVEFDLIKTNNTPKLRKSIYFHINDDGVVEHISPDSNRIESLASELADVLLPFAKENRYFTRRELMKEKAGKNVADAFKERFEDFRRGEFSDAIDCALEHGYIREHRRSIGKGQTRIEYIPLSGSFSDKTESRKIDGYNSCSGYTTYENNDLKPETVTVLNDAEKHNNTDMIKPENEIDGKSEFPATTCPKSLEKIAGFPAILKDRGENFPAFTLSGSETEIAGYASGKFSTETVPCKTARQEAYKCKYFSSIDRNGNIFCGYKCRGKPQPLKQIPPSIEVCPYSEYWLKCIKKFPN